MTNTLHRHGRAASFEDDYILFAIPCKGKNDEDALRRLKGFLKICAQHHPVNMGNSTLGGYTSSRGLNPRIHWHRDTSTDYDSVISSVDKIGTVAAVFDSREKSERCLAEVIKADLGLSINMSTSIEGARSAAEDCGIHRHSVEYSLGFFDPHDHLPNNQVLELSTMCGHGMVSFNLAQKMLEMVREGRRTTKQAVATLARFCPCGVYNPERAKRLIEKSCGQQD